MKLSEEVIKALQFAISVYGGQAALADRAGIHRTKPGQYLRRRSETIPEQNWDKLYPVIAQFLPQGADGLPLPEYRPSSWWIERKNKVTPIIGKGIQSPSMPTCKVWTMSACATGDVLFGDVIPDGEDHLDDVAIPEALQRYKNVCAVRAVGTSMQPGVNDGDILFFVPSVELTDNNIAVVKFNDDTVVCKRWHRKCDTVILTSDAPGITPLIIDGKDIKWAYRVMARVSLC